MTERVSIATAEARANIRELALKIEDLEVAVPLSLLFNGILRRLDELEELVQTMACEMEARRG